MAASNDFVVPSDIVEVNMDNNPNELEDCYTTDNTTTTEVHNGLIENENEERSVENDEITQVTTAINQNPENVLEASNTSGLPQNSLDILSKACGGIPHGVLESNDSSTKFSEPSEYQVNPTEESQYIDIDIEENNENNGDNNVQPEIFVEYVCEENQCSENSADNLTNDDQVLRKSNRKRCPRPKSPDFREKVTVKKQRNSLSLKQNQPKKPTGETFKCDLCGSPNVTDPTRRGSRPKISSCSASPRHKKDPETGKILTLCNACGLSFNRPKKTHEKVVFNPEAKKTYLEEARQFAVSLSDGLGEQDALRLYCPRFKNSPCGCLQRYILADGDMNESRERAQELLNLLKQSKILSKQKCYTNQDELVENPTQEKPKKGKTIGLGNGQRKSKEFEKFVLNQRKFLREELKLCEQATQRVLSYSNNFLHKKLKTDPTKPLRIERQKGQAILGKLKTIEELPTETCCVDKCVMMAVTHNKLLQQWRSRSASGQAEARRVLAEMLTPSGGARSNCYKFISWVTGCSYSTIGRVNEQMKKTGGDREPPPHGLISWWKENPKPKKVKLKTISHNTTSSSPHTVQIQHFAQAQLHNLPQIGILQAAANSAGISTAILPPSQLQGSPQVIAINPAHLTQLNVSNMSLPATQIPTSTTRQVILTPTQHTQLQLQQLQQQQHQLQLQSLQLQQQLQQQLQLEQQQLLSQQQQTQNESQSIQIQLPNQVLSANDTTCLTLASSHDFPSDTFTTTLHPVSQVQTHIPVNCVTNNLVNATQVQQGASLASDNFLSSDALQILNPGQTVAPHIVTLQCSNGSATHAVPVSLIQTPVTLTL